MMAPNGGTMDEDNGFYRALAWLRERAAAFVAYMRATMRGDSDD